MEKYPKIPELHELDAEKVDVLFSSEVFVFEKLDGGNVYIAKENGVLEHGLRSGRMDGNKLKGVKWGRDFNRFFFENYVALMELPGGGGSSNRLIYHGEFLAPHKIDYKEEFVNNFFLIDVSCRGRLMDYRSVVKHMGNLRGVIQLLEPLHLGMMARDDVGELIEHKSSYSMDGKMEGIVIKNYKEQMFAKVLRNRVDGDLVQ